jgi:hypothetical protein
MASKWTEVPLEQLKAHTKSAFAMGPFGSKIKAENFTTVDLFKFVVEEAAFEIPDHFALLNDPGSLQERAAKEARLLKLRVRPLWYSTPEGVDGKPDHSLLEQILKLAIAVARQQVVFG